MFVLSIILGIILLIFIILLCSAYKSRKELKLNLYGQFTSVIAMLFVLVLTIYLTDKSTKQLINANNENSKTEITNLKNEVDKQITENWKATEKHINTIKNLELIKQKHYIELAIIELDLNLKLINTFNESKDLYLKNGNYSNNTFSVIGIESVLENMSVPDKSLINKLMVIRAELLIQNKILNAVKTQEEKAVRIENMQHFYNRINDGQFLKSIIESKNNLQNYLNAL